MKITLEISKPRANCLGLWKFRGGRHFIYVSGDLSPEQFFVTLTHEIAHAKTWDGHKGYVKPHGSEWKLAYRQVAEPLLLGHFNPQFEEQFRKHLKNPTASSMTKIDMAAAADPCSTYLANLPIGTVFNFVNNKRIFKVIAKRRTNYDIIELSTSRPFVGKAAAKVECH